MSDEPASVIEAVRSIVSDLKLGAEPDNGEISQDKS